MFSRAAILFIIANIYIYNCNGIKRNCTRICPSGKAKKVCGSDGTTYASKCRLANANRCNKSKIFVYFERPCKSDCVAKRIEMIRDNKANNKNVKDSYIPVCQKNGAYKRLQCYKELCWCVTEKGKKYVTRTSTDKPKTRDKLFCPKITKYAKKERRGTYRRNKGKRRKCKRNKKLLFNFYLMKVFDQEYERRLNVTKKIDYNTILKWKFNLHDTNGDKELDMTELKNLKKIIRRIIKPKACAQKFHKYCDRNKNKKISLYEWQECLKVSSRKNPRKKRKRKKILRQKIFPKNMPLMERKKAIDKYNQVNKNDCQLQDKSQGTIMKCEGRLYARLQCIMDKCFCVYPNTGELIDGIYFAIGEPVNCLKRGNSAKKKKRTRDIHFKGCRKKRTLFLNKLLDFILVDMRKNTRFNQITNGEEIMRWKFNDMDRNKNKRLERREVQVLKRKLISTFKLTTLKSCSKRFIRFCDSNKDKFITEEEWLKCSLKNGINPLERYLRND